MTIMWITIILLVTQTLLNITGAKMMGRVASIGSYVEIFGTIGIALILASAGFNHGFGFLFTSQGAENIKTNSLQVGFSGIYLSFLMTVLGALFARTRGLVPVGHFTLGAKGMLVIMVAIAIVGLIVYLIAQPGKHEQHALQKDR